MLCVGRIGWQQYNEPAVRQDRIVVVRSSYGVQGVQWRLWKTLSSSQNFLLGLARML